MSAQRGAVLMVGLVFLLLLTLLATSSMQNATLQEKMSGSQAQRDASFQAAESALRSGEARVQSSGFSPDRCAGPLDCLPPSDAVTVFADGSDSALGADWTKGNDGFFRVQYLGETDGAVGSDINGLPQPLYRVTAVGVFGTTRTVLESLHTGDQRIMWRQRL